MGTFWSYCLCGTGCGLRLKDFFGLLIERVLLRDQLRQINVFVKLFKGEGVAFMKSVYGVVKGFYLNGVGWFIGVVYLRVLLYFCLDYYLFRLVDREIRH